MKIGDLCKFKAADFNFFSFFSIRLHILIYEKQNGSCLLHSRHIQFDFRGILKKFICLKPYLMVLTSHN